MWLPYWTVSPRENPFLSVSQGQSINIPFLIRARLTLWPILKVGKGQGELADGVTKTVLSNKAFSRAVGLPGCISLTSQPSNDVGSPSIAYDLRASDI